MYYPQDKLKKITENCCLFMCYIFSVDRQEKTQGQWLRLLADAFDSGLIDEECTVLDAEKLLKLYTGKNYTVEKKEVNSIADIKKLCPVRYNYNGHGHWVLVEDGKIIFNSLLNSVCVTKGKPTTARIIRGAK